MRRESDFVQVTFKIPERHPREDVWEQSVDREEKRAEPQSSSVLRDPNFERSHSGGVAALKIEKIGGLPGEGGT